MDEIYMRPAAFPEDLWERIRFNDRPEAGVRGAFMVARGLTPSEALIDAVRTMRLDALEFASIVGATYDLDHHLGFPWEVIHGICQIMPNPWRRPDGRYVRRIMGLATNLELFALAQVNLGHRTGEDEWPGVRGDDNLKRLDEMLDARAANVAEELRIIDAAVDALERQDMVDEDEDDLIG